MYKYKRGIDNIEQAKNMEFCLSNNLNTYFSMTACLENKRPYNGLYIKNNKILLSNVIEKIETDKKIYKMAMLSTSIKNIFSDEYIQNIDLNTNTIEYNVENIFYSKKIVFLEAEPIFYIEYNVKNKSDRDVIFKFIPLVTYRDIYEMKKSTNLKFNQRDVKAGQLINLSVTDQENLVLKSDTLKFVKDIQYLNSVKHEYINKKFEKHIYIEDLYIPGYFETIVKSNSDESFRLYFSYQDFDLTEILNNNKYINNYSKAEQIKANIADEYFELQDIVTAIDVLDCKDLLISSVPYKMSDSMLEYILNLTEIIKSVEGQYIITKKYQRAIDVIKNVNAEILKIDSLYHNEYSNNKEFILLKLWLIESINRLLQVNAVTFDKEPFYEMVEKIVGSIIVKNKFEKNEYMNYIDVISLYYNALKIYEDILVKQEKQNIINDIAEDVKTAIINDFLYEEKKLMKYDLRETQSYANINMIYTLSLSYPCIYGTIPIMLLDSIFKELYTPYGLRKISKNSPEYDGCIYPKYMAHFVKANLRQNGVTRASQKIAYNLVKELLADVNKYVNGGIKQIYHEKGYHVDTISFDLFTNAEMIRLYYMLM